jgi:glycosyltransferase involved in cell wall biosynthesis
MSSWINHQYPLRRLPQKISNIPSSIKIESSVKDNINNFHQNHKNYLITFIIPTINRDSLINSITSLINQTHTLWKAIIIFDGCKPNDPKLLALLNDSRITYLSISKTGIIINNDHVYSSAGYVRNIGLKMAQTPWIAFLDDDDTIDPKYIDYFMQEIETVSDADVIIFRMLDNDKIIPSFDCNKIIKNNIGISFIINASLLKEGFLFKQSHIEDYLFLKELYDANKVIVLSPYITYYVRGTNPTNNMMLPDRIILY